MNVLKTITILLSLFSTSFIHAEEGMWLPSLLGNGKIVEMQEKGLQLSAEDIYSINQASLKDAIVNFGGCTAELISDKGLIVTNHHCGYKYIQSHSSLQNDYLTNGFWAMNQKEELPNEGLTVSFLKEMKDVTSEVNKGVKNSMADDRKKEIIDINKKKILNKIKEEGKGYSATIETMYHGNQYFLFVYEVFEDVRLVGTPPSAIGKFGGDTDNWMWPRHTGDFSLFRIYADKNNNPAKYSADNVPYKPDRSLTISTEGINEGDFTMVYGFPGVTSEYMFSDGVRYIAEKGNPTKIKLRTERLNIMNYYQNRDPEVRIKYAAKNASVANAWKKWQGETKGINKLNVISEKNELENKFILWSNDKDEYKNIIPEFRRLYADIEPYQFFSDYYKESIQAIELLKFGYSLANKGTNELSSENRDKVKEEINKFFKDYHQPLDRQTAKYLLKMFIDEISEDFYPEIVRANKLEVDVWVDKVFDESVFSDKERIMSVLDSPVEEIVEKFKNDPATIIYSQFDKLYKDSVEKKLISYRQSINKLYKSYMKGLMEMMPNHDFYPDANSTLRVAYGEVSGFNPADAVEYKYFSTLEGIIEKDNPEIYDYKVPEKLKELYKNKDYGHWEVNGTVPVAFIASNHTTGGNSGSPVLNNKGELIGVNFDRCWESTMSDIKYDKELCRNIAVDIRYVLFIIDKFAGASYLLEEMNIK